MAVLILVAGCVLSGVVLDDAPPASAAPGESTVPAPNPDLAASCGIDIHVVLDRSGSIAQSGATQQVQSAFRAFVSALRNTGSRMSVSQFSSVAELPIGQYTTVTDATIASTFEPYIASFRPEGYTHWEDGFRVPRYFAPRPDPARPHLVLFITDGNPNTVARTDRVTYDPGNPNVAQNQYELQLPLTEAQTQHLQDNESGRNQATKPAVANANALKGEGSHVLAVAVGDGLSGGSTLQRLSAISGPDVYSGTGTFDISTADVYRVADFDLLEAALRDAAFQLCAPSVNIRKLVDVNPDPVIDDLQPGQGWTMQATVDPVPASWVLPAGAGGPSATADTDPTGFVNFQWNTSAGVPSSVTVAEVQQPGFMPDPAATTCIYITPEITDPQPLPDFVSTPGGFSGTVPEDAIVTCDLVNRVVPEPSVDLEKSTNGDDADVAPGPSVPIGEAVVWTYEVTNTGNVPLTDIILSDVPAPASGITCPVNLLPPGESMICEATGTSVAGPFENVAHVDATPTSGGPPVADDDPSHYFGSAAGIDIEKATNGIDADRRPGPLVAVGDTVTWTYVVTNTGNVPLTDVAVEDDEVGPITCPQDTLAVGESFTCTETGVASAGQYDNVGLVNGQSGATTVGDSDASHYFGEEPSIDIEKSTNGDDADAAPGPFVTAASPVVWRYELTNTGNVPLLYSVSDDQGVAIACPRIAVILPGRTVTCFAVGDATPGQYANVGSVLGTAPSGRTVGSSDPSHYFGVEAGIQIEKATNGIDADEPPGPFISIGGAVTWTYVVTNDGNSPLSSVAVVDNLVGPITCPLSVLAAGQSMTCTASGAAQPEEYTNFATATGISPTGDEVSATDPSHYFGADSGIRIEKSTNGVDADEAPGPFIAVGEPVAWTYDVSNTGNTVLTDVLVSDDQGVAVSCPQTALQPAETMRCTADGVADIGQYANIGFAQADGALGPVTDEDPSHYFGALILVDIEKSTNGDDADEPPGPAVGVGGQVIWTYLVANPGNIPLSDVVVVDDRGVELVFVDDSGNGDDLLDPAETWTFEGAGVAIEGQYENNASVTARPVLEAAGSVTDADPSHYYGMRGDLAVDKEVDRDVVTVGETVTFTVTVTNTGNVPLNDVVIVDEQAPGCSLDVGTLAVGQSVSQTCEVVVDGPILNVATVTATEVDGVVIDRTDDATVEVLAAQQQSGTLPSTGSTVGMLVAVGAFAVAAGCAVEVHRRWRGVRRTVV